jgi:hypothetical protein
VNSARETGARKGVARPAARVKRMRTVRSPRPADSDARRGGARYRRTGGSIRCSGGLSNLAKRVPAAGLADRSVPPPRQKSGVAWPPGGSPPAQAPGGVVASANALSAGPCRARACQCRDHSPCGERSTWGGGQEPVRSRHGAGGLQLAASARVAGAQTLTRPGPDSPGDFKLLGLAASELVSSDSDRDCHVTVTDWSPQSAIITPLLDRLLRHPSPGPYCQGFTLVSW